MIIILLGFRSVASISSDLSRFWLLRKDILIYYRESKTFELKPTIFSTKIRFLSLYCNFIPHSGRQTWTFYLQSFLDEYLLGFRVTPIPCFTPFCFTPLYFTAPCQFTPLLTLRSLFFVLTPFLWFIFICLFVLWEYHFWFTPTFSGT